jgi:hypothetical protein
MPVTIKKKKGGKYRVSTPHGTKSKGTTLAKAKRQRNLLNAVEHGWHPTGASARDSGHSGSHHAAKLYNGK